MRRPSTKDGDELLARIVMQSALGVPVCRHDDRSGDSMYDLQVRYPDRPWAAAEVTSTRDKAALRLSAATSGRGYTQCPELAYKWIITVKPDARIKQLRRIAPTTLADLEQAGILHLRRDAFFDPWPPEFRKLGVASCYALEVAAPSPPGFYILPFSTASRSIDANEVVRRSEALISANPDVMHKLRISGRSEWHVVIVLTIDWLGEFGTIEDGAVPTLPPDLPEGLDRLWIVTLKNLPVRAVYWLGDGEWRKVVVGQEEGKALAELFEAQDFTGVNPSPPASAEMAVEPEVT